MSEGPWCAWCDKEKPSERHLEKHRRETDVTFTQEELAEHDRQVAERAYRAAEDAAAEALTKWWLTDTSPDEDTSSVMDVRNAIRGLYRAAKGEQK